MHACAVFVLPSVTRAEAFGYVQLEAMAAGKPVISTDVPSGVSWVNQDGRTGLVVPGRRRRGAARGACVGCSKTPACGATIGAAGRARVEEEFTLGHLRERLRAAVRGGGGAAAVARCMLKRAFDVALSAAGLIASSPLWALFAAAIKLEDGGPVFFRQERVGLGGRGFMAMKFRSMRPDARGGRGRDPGDRRTTRA